MSDRKLLMIPGPIELSPAVLTALKAAPPSHVAPDFIEIFGASLELMRQVWGAGPKSQPFIIAGSGTIAMEMAVANVVARGQRALVVNTGYFSARMAEMLRRRGVEVGEVGAPAGKAPSLEEIETALDSAQQDGRAYDALFATHVDTSTGVRVDAQAIARAADRRGLLSVFDGVCATAGEAFEMQSWGADIYLTASQKAIGAPPGLALMVFSERALEARKSLSEPPPMSVDIEQWSPIMQAYEARKGSYFSTPATSLVCALFASLSEITAFEASGQRGIGPRIAAHQRCADGMRAAWAALGLELFCEPDLSANTMSALRYPDGVDGARLLAGIKARGVVVAGGLYPGRQDEYFRVGHMGHVIERPSLLAKTVRAVGETLVENGHPADVEAALATLRERVGG
ncbi:pyridoxal-phosphate-dependent aminotransferase family protein [Bradymonas sediminis]|uniref:Alanine--glyoxylate aminotransferase family protein n=1 Tax=Bradymonas sediminis TaxID=1548548 RepID=A0A2Z4FJN4_9DELT|nr:alanine--glyoxylate aminotransferase family protein [Bradymonas sediminis]AWV88908.1 alanine--glyoxylate aminotransferase family protein [Bradymonas sediminis]TDP71915.1 alanine-glyoxylate transaminase/serine-glyoxylate transaminase/serine-pyruvate transaminase [Bradymonas sediminis]